MNILLTMPLKLPTTNFRISTLTKKVFDKKVLKCVSLNNFFLLIFISIFNSLVRNKSKACFINEKKYANWKHKKLPGGLEKATAKNLIVRTSSMVSVFEICSFYILALIDGVKISLFDWKLTDQKTFESI